MDARVHAAHRSRAAQDIIATSERSVHSIIEAQSAAGVPVANIYATMLNQDPNTLIVPKDIANAKDSARRRVLTSATPIEALFNQLNQDKIFYRYTTHLETQRLKYLLWAHPATASLYKVNSDILVMDCTYKSNKFDLPLLNVISLTGMDTVIPVCQAWIPGEKKQDYTWALNMLRLLILEYDVPEPRIISHDRDQALMNPLALVFSDVPTILCRWHMNKNVLSKVREVLGKVAVENPAPGQSKYSNSLATDKFMALFYRTIDLETEEDFRANKAALAESNAQLAAYLSEHWWKYEDKIVKVRTNRFMHFGVRDTSTVEGTHAQCKRWIKSTRGDLMRECLSRNETIVPYQLQFNEFAACVKVITNWALYKTDERWNQARKSIVQSEALPDCSGIFRATHGMPCVHELKAIIESEGRLHLMPSHFDKHWWIQQGPEHEHIAAARIHDPLPARAKGCRKPRESHTSGTTELTAQQERWSISNVWRLMILT
ncbi:hypothetical protein AM588_10007297 [Phytophthora nicotianae]|uniref:MULE transposase domain-containing protein n=1 Tax=Phytophthora nicotianae TaxID=4792 RepID=A0A0W8DBC3_PHYNI|nr:hypothetical protein AM588_10007297 [Phytophthora nicotianae]